MRFINSWRTSSDEEMIREFDWKPRWATIRSEKVCARSTFEPSSAPDCREPRPPVPAMPIWASPELLLWM
ncbi:hypothetical protein D3C72_2086400 [compost metagenome]